MDRKQLSVLFVAPHAACMYAMLPLAERLVRDGGYRPVFFIFREGKYSEDQLKDLENRGIEWIRPSALEYLEHRPSSKLEDWLGRISRITVGDFRSTVLLALDYARILRCSTEVLLQEDVKCLVLIGDRHVGWENSLIKKGVELSIPSLVVPFAASGPNSDARVRLQKGTTVSQYRRQGVVNRTAAALFPKWVYEYEGEALLFYPGSVGLIAWLFGIMPGNPWSLVGGRASRVAVENKRILEQFVNQGQNRVKMVVTGYPLMDGYVIDEPGQIETVRRLHGVQVSETMVVLAVPHLAEHGLLPWDEHIRIVEAVVDSILCSERVKLVLSLHPKSHRSNYQYLEDKHPLSISSESVYTLISACDIYVATNSSTVMQAIGLSKPSIVIDYFGTASEDLGGAPGVVLVDIRGGAKAVSREIEKMVCDSAYYQSLKMEQAENSGDWVSVDRRCTDRVVTEIYGLMNGRSP